MTMMMTILTMMQGCMMFGWSSINTRTNIVHSSGKNVVFAYKFLSLFFKMNIYIKDLKCKNLKKKSIWKNPKIIMHRQTDIVTCRGVKRLRLFKKQNKKKHVL